MKKILSFILVAILAIVLLTTFVACDNSTVEKQEDNLVDNAVVATPALEQGTLLLSVPVAVSGDESFQENDLSNKDKLFESIFFELDSLMGDLDSAAVETSDLEESVLLFSEPVAMSDNESSQENDLSNKDKLFESIFFELDSLMGGLE